MDKNYKEIDFRCGCTIKDAVEELLYHKNKGQLVCGSFNGVILYSDTVTLDNAYKEITGKNEAELEQEEQEWRENYKRQEEEYKQRIPELTEEWIKKGKEILSEDKWDYWCRIVPIRLSDLYHGMELGNCLDIVKILNNNGTLDEAKEQIESQGHSGMSYGLVCSMVKEFCSRGSEFMDYIA